MAADTRPFKSKEQDGQGNDIIIRDQQLVEQTSQTTMASTEYFEIVDVDGRMAKIPKDNMIGVVREALGSLLNGLADQTTVTKALTLNGDTLGASTAATLASVLGVMPVSRRVIAPQGLKQGDGYCYIETGLTYTRTQPVAFYSNERYGWTFSFSAVSQLWIIIVNNATLSDGNFGGTLYYGNV